MATSQMNAVIHHLRRAALLPAAAGLTDGQLLECFVSRREEAALEHKQQGRLALLVPVVDVEPVVPIPDRYIGAWRGLVRVPRGGEDAEHTTGRFGGVRPVRRQPDQSAGHVRGRHLPLRSPGRRAPARWTGA
jgi:hypothetical protein